tara:strand:+ start:38685 stop:38876 length:192 start_codon:yes stop_codon:yes gene_type:complete
MKFKLLDKVFISENSNDLSGSFGIAGVVIQLKQSPTDPLPMITILLENGEEIEDLFPTDIQHV